MGSRFPDYLHSWVAHVWIFRHGKPRTSIVLCQGTTSVVPKNVTKTSGLQPLRQHSIRREPGSPATGPCRWGGRRGFQPPQKANEKIAGFSPGENCTSQVGLHPRSSSSVFQKAALCQGTTLVVPINATKTPGLQPRREHPTRREAGVSTPA
jgi:hypothetical protein